ncbi:hypothetical protein VP01_1080g9 [Puccinia sorghi]|uniref:Uncharacterized protein n=1 Tax=Puccinia sorghi TaxID=27349 RepID=A0A0L6VUS6_9BASI|nr:hypothetical protein VP01_1080g9 [Puccinia sorghi]
MQFRASRQNSLLEVFKASGSEVMLFGNFAGVFIFFFRCFSTLFFSIVVVLLLMDFYQVFNGILLINGGGWIDIREFLSLASLKGVLVVFGVFFLIDCWWGEHRSFCGEGLIYPLNNQEKWRKRKTVGSQASESPKREHSQSLSGFQCAKRSNKGVFVIGDSQLLTESFFLCLDTCLVSLNLIHHPVYIYRVCLFFTSQFSSITLITSKLKPKTISKVNVHVTHSLNLHLRSLSHIHYRISGLRFLLFNEIAPQTWIGRFNKLMRGVYQNTNVVGKWFVFRNIQKGVEEKLSNIFIDQGLKQVYQRVIKGFFDGMRVVIICFQKSTLFKTCFFFTSHLLGLINEEINFLIIDWFVIVDFLYLIHPIDEIKKALLVAWLEHPSIRLGPLDTKWELGQGLTGLFLFNRIVLTVIIYWNHTKLPIKQCHFTKLGRGLRKMIAIKTTCCKESSNDIPKQKVFVFGPTAINRTEISSSRIEQSRWRQGPIFYKLHEQVFESLIHSLPLYVCTLMQYTGDAVDPFLQSKSFSWGQSCLHYLILEDHHFKNSSSLHPIINHVLTHISRELPTNPCDIEQISLPSDRSADRAIQRANNSTPSLI